MNILHILNSDFGSRATMGIRSYYITTQLKDYSVFCRGNLSNVRDGIYTPVFGFRMLSRGIQFLRMIHHSFAKLKWIEKRIFEISCKKYIKKADAIHLFYHSRTLMDYAHQLKKKVIVEGFTNPLIMQEMHANGIKLDNEKFELNVDELYCYQNCDLLISPSKWVTQSMTDLPIKGKIVEIPYGVERFESCKKEVSNKIKFCFAGGLKRTKGIIDLLEAVKELNVDFKDLFEVHLYGRIYSELNFEIEELKSDNIFFHGYIDDVKKIFYDKHVYVFPTYYEGSSKTVFEAMAFGLPVITTFNSGSQVIDGVNGFIINMNSASDIFIAMRKFILDKELIEKMGIESFKIIKQFTWENYAKNVCECYGNIF